MTEIIFVDEPAHIPAVRAMLGPGRCVIAVTAQAAEALESAGVAHEPIGQYADLRDLSLADDGLNRDTFELAADLEQFVAERWNGPRVDGSGFATGHSYYLQYSVSAIAKRGLLMRGAIRELRPGVVTLFDGPIDPWFLSDGYESNPWVILAAQLAQDTQASLNVVHVNGRETGSGRRTRAAELLRNPVDSYIRGSRKLRRELTRLQHSLANRWSGKSSGGPRLLFGDGFNDYFGPVVPALVSGRAEIFAVGPQTLNDSPWALFYPPVVLAYTGERFDLALPLPERAYTGDAGLGRLFEEWLGRSDRRGLSVLDFDVVPALAPQLRAITERSPYLLQHSDIVTVSMLDRIRPDAVLFSSITSLPQKQLAHRCRERGIPVVVYQHAFGYEAQRHASGEQIDASIADYFLTFGDGVQPRARAVFPPRAKYVSVGSARIEAMRDRYVPRNDRKTAARLLWIAEHSNGNTQATTLREDTTRYRIQRECLELLGSCADLHVTYRPYPHCDAREGTSQWLRRRKLPTIEIDTARLLEELIVEADVVIVDTTSPTTWGEVVALEVPMLLFCDPIQARVDPRFAEDLDKVSIWCRTPTELNDAVRRLAERRGGVPTVDPVERARFLERYVLGARQDRCTDRATEFILRLAGKLQASPS